MRYKAHVKQLLVARVVVVLLRLDPWILDRLDLHLEAKPRSLRLDQPGECEHAEGLRELVEHAVFTGSRGIQYGQLHAAQRIANVQESAGLRSAAVAGERNARR